MGYTTDSAELDDILWDSNTELLILHAAGNAGVGGPNGWVYAQAAAKNALGVGGIDHHDTLSKTDDTFPTSYPHGPTSDGRIKPDLVHFADAVLTIAPDPNCFVVSHDYDYAFGGSSAATPITAGHAGLFFQMWHEQVFAGFGGGASVFDDRPHVSTTKAMLINTAAPYELTQLSRGQQGWGMVDLQRMYDARVGCLIIDESILLDDDPGTPEPNMMEWTYTVGSGMEELRVTLVYTDPPGNPWENPPKIPPIGGGPPMLKNDLDLKVISPAPSSTEYWGNYGLGNHRLLPPGVLPSNWSRAGGWSDDRNNVENVFIEAPAAGDWIVRVSLRRLVEDGHLETAEQLDVDFALVVTTLPSGQ